MLRLACLHDKRIQCSIRKDWDSRKIDAAEENNQVAVWCTNGVEPSDEVGEPGAWTEALYCCRDGETAKSDPSSLSY